MERGHPENVLALYSVSSAALPRQRRFGNATRTAGGGRVGDVSIVPARGVNTHEPYA